MKYRTMSSIRISQTILAVWISFTIYAVADTDTDIEAPLDASAMSGQMPNPVGASRVFPKTSFTCKNRPAGYYADVETGCQVYHMCDGVGRQFSYACPNTTLFQQRMLICDHWYMVNCSRAENDYAANLLIGQKDKPFVPENEHQQRTPRPDLLDRPYAPDYSGESFRNNYKDLPPIQNHISDSFHSKDLGKPLPTRWSLKNSLKAKENSIYSNRRSDSATDDSDLGTSFSLRYNSTGDISSELITEPHTPKTTDFNTIIESNRSQPQIATATVKVPSKIYEPPFLHPIYNTDYTTNLTATSTTTTAFATSPSTTEATTTTKLTTQQSIPIETVTFTGRPFEVTNSIAPSAAESSTSRKGANDDRDYSKLIQQLNPITEKHAGTTTNFFKTSTFENHIDGHYRGSTVSFEPKTKDKSPFGLPAESMANDLPPPPRDLLPPHQKYVIHDVATTQGPPIYYEWKTPADSLEPPKLSVETASSADSPNSSSESSKLAPAFSHNPFLSTLARTKNSPSEDKDALLDSSAVSKSSGKIGGALKRLVSDFPTDQQIEEIQRELLIPDFLFPLESEGRTGYELDDPLDSFQLKVPRKRNVRTVRRQRRHS